MSHQKKPYLVVPFFVEQPTWGGEYICKMKGWLEKEELRGKKIGQSYELYSKTLLATHISSTNDPLFSPSIDKAISVSEFKEARPFPLIKFTQAKGNSFQLHVRPGTSETYWQPKAESWYFLENGKITFGVKKGVDVDKYKTTCIAIDNEMKKLSEQVRSGSLTLSQAKQKAKEQIAIQNPWQFVNVHEVKKGDVVDLSGGGLHHSWEEDENSTQGNIVYEVQQDVMDPVSTLRSFDQGKIKEDGTIREIQIEKYFEYLDSNEKRNALSLKESANGNLFDTPFYSLSLLSLSGKKKMESASSFHHLFVKEGEIEVDNLVVGKGHSCFVPQGTQYEINSKTNSEVLLTFLR
jgi:hypothetical protein